MRTSRVTVATGLSALFLFALTACAPGAGGDGSGGDGTDPEGSSGAPVALGDCMLGSWEADLDDLAQQLQAYFVANGTPVTSIDSAGSYSLDVDSESMTYTSAAHFTAVADSNGVAMVIEQDQTGVSAGHWSVVGDSVVYSDWENNIEITTTITMSGQSSDAPITVPADGGDGLEVATTCHGDTLTTAPAASPFTTTWVRVG